MSTIPTSLPQSGFLTPPQVGLAYNVPLPSATQGAGFTVGIISLGGGFRQSDLARSFADLKTAGLLPADAVAPTVNVTLIDGATGTYGVNSSNDFENTGDIYCVGTMVPGASINIYIGAGRTSLDNCIAQAVADHVDVITISWGYDDSVYGDFCASSLAAAALARIPVLACTGDYGSAAYSTDTNEYPQYPASSPLAIAVGGTNLTLDTNNQRLTETVESNDPEFSSDTGWSGGGGISSLFSAPSWQAGLTYTPYNTSTGAGSPTVLTNRGTPDISLAMNAYVLYKGGGLAYFGGTSAATPVMAGIMVRLIEATGKRQSSANWNKFFYNNYNASTFYDITSGNDATLIANGYLATSGWDPVVGLGVPNGIGLYNSLLSTPTPRRVVNRGATPTPTPIPTQPAYTPTPAPLPASINLLTVLPGAKPQLRDYNALVTDLTILTRGYYGYSMTSTLQSPGDPITQNEWASLYDDVQACYIHQNGFTATNIVRATTSTVIQAQDINNLESTVQTLIANTTTVAANQLTTIILNSPYRSTPSWGSTFIYSVIYHWSTGTDVGYFFNLGGRIQPNFSTLGASLTDDFSYLVNNLNSLYYDHTDYISGSTFTETITSGTNTLKVDAGIVGPTMTVTATFTNSAPFSDLVILGAMELSYSNNLTGGIAAPVPATQLAVGGSLSPLPIPTFNFPIHSSQTQTMVVGNKTGSPVYISMSLAGYAGTLSTSTYSPLANNTTASFTINYAGDTAGAYAGQLIFNTSIGNSAYDTTILIGTSVAVSPTSASTTLTRRQQTYTTQPFTVAAVGTNETTYTVSLSNINGFSTSAVGATDLSQPFTLTFDPANLPNGTYSTVATIVAGGVSTTTTFTVTVNIAAPQHLGSWISALSAYNAVMGFSYDVLEGVKCLTIGIGANPTLDSTRDGDGNVTAPDMTELRQVLNSSTFPQWSEVYRIPLTGPAKTYYSTIDYLLQSGVWNGQPLDISTTFGSGDSQGSICTVIDDGLGNLNILLNNLNIPASDTVFVTQLDLQYCFNYYDEISNRYVNGQLETALPNGNQTHCFIGFNSSGVVQTTLVYPNFANNDNSGGGD